MEDGSVGRSCIRCFEPLDEDENCDCPWASEDRAIEAAIADGEAKKEED